MRLTIGFSTSNSLFARSIRYITKSNVSHVYVRFFDPFLDTELVLNADWEPGAVVEDWEIFKLQNKIVNEFEITAPQNKKAIKENLKNLRKKYAKWTIIKWFVFLTFKRWIKKKVKKPTENPKELICVDFVLYITNKAVITSLPYDEYVPDTLMKLFIEKHETMGLTWSVKDGIQTGS